MPNRWLRLTPLLAAIVTVMLNTAGAFVLAGSGPDGSAPGQRVINYFASHRANNQAWSILVAGTLLFFLIFAGFLREYLRRVVSVEVFASIALAGAVVFSAGFATSASVDATLASSPSSLQPAAAQALNSFSNAPIYAANIGACLFGVAAGLAIIFSGSLPRWIGWVALVLGVASLTPLGEVAFNLILLWTLAAAIALYRSERRHAADGLRSTTAAA